MMKTFPVAGMMLAIGMLGSGANAADFDDYARVISVAPQIDQINAPQRECRTEYVQVQRRAPRDVGGSIIGGLAGGLLGNQIGGGNGRVAATAAGAMVGAIVGDRVENRDDAVAVAEQPVRECRMVDHWISRNDGYQVTYEYHGHTYTSMMPYDPGERLRVHVALSPRI